jgi:hypothetical protein
VAAAWRLREAPRLLLLEQVVVELHLHPARHRVRGQQRLSRGGVEQRGR